MGLSSEPLWRTKRHDIIYFYPSTHLKRQTNVLRDKMGMDFAP